MKKPACLAILLALTTLPVAAAPRTVTLDVPGMTCATCPITVKKALSRVDGVTKAVVDYDRKLATVTFDDSKTSADALTEATAEAGYPATVKGK